MLGKIKRLLMNAGEKQEAIFDESLSGTHVYDSEKICEGYRLNDGNLIDIGGKKIREWKYKYLGGIDKNGDYYAQEYYESPTWGRFDWQGNSIWISEIPIHHDIVLTPDKLITFTKEMHEYKGRKVDFCVILELDKTGNIIGRWSIWDNLEYLKKFHAPLELERHYSPLIRETAKRKDKTPWGGNYDYYRLNSLQIIPANNLGEKDKRFQKGNWLISFRHGSMIFILDKDTKEIVWKCISNDVKDNIEGPHSPQILENGNVLLFDNGRYRGWSRVIEINPVNLQIVWEYNSSKKEDFFSLSQGYCQKLRNGNVLITESELGRVFEITSDKKIVWEFYHPEKQTPENSPLHPENHGKRQWIYRMNFYDKKFVDSL